MRSLLTVDQVMHTLEKDPARAVLPCPPWTGRPSKGPYALVITLPQQGVANQAYLPSGQPMYNPPQTLKKSTLGLHGLVPKPSLPTYPAPNHNPLRLLRTSRFSLFSVYMSSKQFLGIVGTVLVSARSSKYFSEMVMLEIGILGSVPSSENPHV